MKRILFLTMAVFLLCSGAAWAQGKTAVQVSVTDMNGEPLPGATVLEVGTRNSATTDVNGKTTISVAPNATLEVSFMGYVTQQVAVTGTAVNVQLEEGGTMLDEVVMVGYGRAHAREVTSSIAHISGSDLTSGVGGASIATALQGKIPGLTISGSASPNASNSFQLRGIASINAGRGPLIVIDGIPGGSINALQQADIESIDVLKDASAAAIYGTRATGGVILITTKKAKAGTLNVQYTTELSTEVVRKRHYPLSAEEYLSNFSGSANYGASTDWYDALLQGNNFSHKHTMTVSGGSDKAQVYASLGASDQNGIVIADSRTDYNGRVNSRFILWDGVAEITLNANYRRAIRDTRGTSTRDANGNISTNTVGDGKGYFGMAMILNPTIPIYYDGDPTGYNHLLANYYNNVDMGMSTDFWNPIADINLKDNKGIDQWLQTDATLKLNLTSNLSVQGTFGWQSTEYQQTRWTSSFHRSAIQGNYAGWAEHFFYRRENISAEAYANYADTFGDKHRINATAGWSFWESGGESFGMNNYNFSVEGIGPWNMADGSWLKDRNAQGTANMNSNKLIRNRLLAIFSRVNYSFDDRYMFSASYRREGSSKFNPENRWGNFWAVSGGWRISGESFMQDFEWLSDLKLRVGYGVTGNNDFGSGQSTRMYAADSPWIFPTGEWSSAYGQSRNINLGLKWEEKGELNVGLDFSLFNNRVWGKFDVYQRKVKDLLYSVAAPVPPMVQSTIMRNIGTLTNNGWELEIGGNVVQQRDMTYSSTIRVSHNSSKIGNLGEQGSNMTRDEVYFPSPGAPGYGVRLKDGSEIGQFWVYKYAGVDNNGQWLIYDKDNNVVPYVGNNRVENKQWVGNAIPKVILSWDHNFRYKNLDVGLNLRSWLGHDVLSQVEMYYGLQSSGGWNVLPSAFGKNKDIKAGKILTYVGYTLQTKQWLRYLNSARVYLTVRDPLVITGYDGLSPEVNINGLAPGFELIADAASMYPQTCRFTIGVELNF